MAPPVNIPREAVQSPSITSDTNTGSSFVFDSPIFSFLKPRRK